MENDHQEGSATHCRRRKGKPEVSKRKVEGLGENRIVVNDMAHHREGPAAR
jgi:hypothetical protein